MRKSSAACTAAKWKRREQRLAVRLQLDYRTFPDEAHQKLRHLAYLRNTTVHALCRDIILKVASNSVVEDLDDAIFPDEVEPDEPRMPGVKPPWLR